MIPLSEPNLSGNEWKYVKDCLDSTWISSVGSYVNRFEEMSAEYCKVGKAVATSNGTAALHISLLLAGVQRGDLVILPNITFVAPANVIKYVGADPVLLDVYADTWQMDVDLMERFLQQACTLRDGTCYHTASGRRVSAVLPVHVLGNMVNMEKLLALAAQYHLTVVEDATEALGSTYKGQPAGSFGLFGTLSYNGNKIITTGGGGMILTNSEVLGKRAKHLTTQAKASSTDYYHDEVGYNYRLVNLLAAVGVAQMEQLPAFIARKKEINALYNRELSRIPGFAPQAVTAHVAPNNWLYTATFSNAKLLLEHLKDKGIHARPFWVPMNLLPAFKDDIYYQEADNAGSVYNNCISLPCSTNISDEALTEVIATIKSFYA